MSPPAIRKSLASPAHESSRLSRIPAMYLGFAISQISSCCSHDAHRRQLLITSLDSFGIISHSSLLQLLSLLSERLLKNTTTLTSLCRISPHVTASIASSERGVRHDAIHIHLPHWCSLHRSLHRMTLSLTHLRRSYLIHLSGELLLFLQLLGIDYLT